MNMIYSTLVDMLAKDEQNRLAQFRAAWKAYYGDLPKPLKVRPGNVDDNIRLNFVRLIVDKGVSFLFGKNLTFELVEGETTPAEEWLAACWQYNRKMTLLQKTALNGGVCGHCFIKIQYSPGDAYPRLIVLDPETVTVTLAADDLEQILSIKIQYPSKDPKTNKPVTIRQVIERDGAVWQITDQVGNVEGTTWRTSGEQRWPYVWLPVVDCQNLPVPNEFWGMSDIEPDVLEINKAINFSVSNTGRILKYHAHPKTWGRGFDGSQLRIAVDETLIIPSELGELHNLEMQTDLSSSIAFYARLKEALYEVSRIPEIAVGKIDSLGVLSGLALEILYAPLLEKTETKRLLYGDMLVELNRRLLAIGGFGEENLTMLHWQEMLPVDTIAKRQAAIIDKQLGVSDNTLLTRLGYDPDVEREKKMTEGADLGERLLRNFDRGG